MITTATRIDPWGQAHRIFAGGAACHWNRRETGSLFIATGIHVRVEVAAAGGGGAGGHVVTLADAFSARVFMAGTRVRVHG